MAMACMGKKSAKGKTCGTSKAKAKKK